MRNTKRGFTLIELLVVIAIIGILSAIVLASLSTARNKANDAKVMSQLASLRSAAEIYSTNNNNTYTNMCIATNADTSGVYPLLQTANYPTGAGGNVTCSSAAGQWSAYKQLSTTGAYACVDSTGASKSYTSGFTAPTGGAACP